MVICTYFGGHWPLVLVCWIRPDSRYTREGVSEVGVTSFIDFWYRCNLLLMQQRKVRTTVYRQQNSTFRKRFLEIGLCSSPSLEYCVRFWCKLIRKLWRSSDSPSFAADLCWTSFTYLLWFLYIVQFGILVYFRCRCIWNVVTFRLHVWLAVLFLVFLE